MAVLAAGLGYFLTRDDAGQDDAQNLPSPASITRDGVTYKVGPTSPAGAALDSEDQRVVTLYAFTVVHPEDPECSSLEPQARVVEESSDEVRIATYDYTVRSEDASNAVNCGYMTTDDEAPLYDALEVRLKEALGGRRLIDDRTGEDIGLLDPDYSPTPAYLPPGFEESLVAHFTPQDDFVALRQYRHGKDQTALEIRVRSATAWDQSGKVLAEDEVANSDATVTEEDYQRCVNWSPRAGLIFEVCSLPASLSPTELLRIARSIPVTLP